MCDWLAYKRLPFQALWALALALALWALALALAVDGLQARGADDIVLDPAESTTPTLAIHGGLFHTYSSNWFQNSVTVS